MNNGLFNTNGYEARYLTFEWDIASQSIDRNQTVINWKLRGNGNNVDTWYMSGNFKVMIDSATVYQSATRIRLQGNTTVASGQFTLTHHQDGSRSFNASAEAGIYYFAVNVSGSGSWSLPTIARATQPTANKSSLSFGESITIYCPRASNHFIHTIQAGVNGAHAFSDIATGVGTSYTWTIPKSWAAYLPRSDMKLRIQVITYSGGIEIGRREVNPQITVYATDDMKPVVNISYSDPNHYYSRFGAFVKGQSRIQAVVSETLYQGASVTQRTLMLNGITYQSQHQTSEVISTIPQTITASVTDSRGKVGTKSITIPTVDWHAPKITLFKANRCRQNGVLDEEGNYIKLDYACAIAPVNNKNQKTLTYGYKKQNTLTETTGTVSMTSFSKTGFVVIPASGEYSWDVSLTLTDSFSSTTVSLQVGTAYTLLDFHHSGKGIGVGKVSEHPLLLDIAPNWNIQYKNQVIADFIVEQGQRGIWFYRKWQSGVIECFGSVQIPTINQDVYRVKIVELPYRLIDTNYTVMITPSTNGHYAQYNWVGGKYATNSKTNTSFSIGVWSDNKMNLTFGMELAVYGKYK